MEHLIYHTALPMFDELRGERVLVRPYRETDAPDLQQAIAESRDHLRPWLPFADRHQTVEETHDWILHVMAHWMLREDLTVGLWDATTSRFVGGSGLHPRNWDIPSFEIGYWVRQSAQGCGYITEAVRLLTDYALIMLGARRVMIRCDERNARSAAVAERLGFVREGRLRNSEITNDGHLRTMLVFSLTADDPR